MKPVEGLLAAKPPVCRHCDGGGADPAETDGRCSWCCGLGVDGADWWWEIVWLRNQLDQLRGIEDVHAEGQGALEMTCVLCLQEWPCEGARS